LIHLLLALVKGEPQSERDEDRTHRPIHAEAGFHGAAPGRRRCGNDQRRICPE
jgi:hypothetical protein